MHLWRFYSVFAAILTQKYTMSCSTRPAGPCSQNIICWSLSTSDLILTKNFWIIKAIFNVCFDQLYTNVSCEEDKGKSETSYSYLAPKPHLKLLLKLNPVAHKQTTSFTCHLQRVLWCWQGERAAQQLHHAHSWATVLSNVSFLISIPNWKENAAPQHVSRKQKKTNAYQTRGVWEEE